MAGAPEGRLLVADSCVLGKSGTARGRGRGRSVATGASSAAAGADCSTRALALDRLLLRLPTRFSTSALRDRLPAVERANDDRSTVGSTSVVARTAVVLRLLADFSTGSCRSGSSKSESSSRAAAAPASLPLLEHCQHNRIRQHAKGQKKSIAGQSTDRCIP